jgi:hypothetical protein
MERVVEGVYFFDAGLSKLVLELKEGHYRYWFSTDARSVPEPTYPMTGKYSAHGATIQLLNHGHTNLEDVWTFRKIDGTSTLWRPNAIRAWHEHRGFDGYGILYPTHVRAEEIWLKSPLKWSP